VKSIRGEREGKKLRGQRKTTGCLLKEREGAVWMMAFSAFGSLSLSLARCCHLLRQITSAYYLIT